MALLKLDDISRRRWRNFKANRRGFWSLWIFGALFVISMLAELVANDKPLLVSFNGELVAPIASFYPETYFGGDFENGGRLPRSGPQMLDPHRWRDRPLSR